MYRYGGCQEFTPWLTCQCIYNGHACLYMHMHILGCRVAYLFMILVSVLLFVVLPLSTKKYILFRG